MQLPGDAAENGGRLAALMERGEGNLQANGGRRQAATELSLENDRQHRDGKSGDRPSFPHLQPPYPRMSTAEAPIFPAPLVPGDLRGLGGYLGV